MDKKPPTKVETPEWTTTQIRSCCTRRTHLREVHVEHRLAGHLHGLIGRREQHAARLLRRRHQRVDNVVACAPSSSHHEPAKHSFDVKKNHHLERQKKSPFISRCIYLATPLFDLPTSNFAGSSNLHTVPIFGPGTGTESRKVPVSQDR